MKNKVAKLYYMSDIHLDYKMGVREEYNIPTDTYIRDVANYLCEALPKDDDTRYLVVCGDVSSNMKHCREFLEYLTPYFNKIYFIPGNHELWKRDVGYWVNYLSDDPKIDVMCNDCITICDTYIVMGVGYAGKNKSFNASYECGHIYRNGLDRDAEIKRSNMFESTFRHALSIRKDKKVIVFSHFPLSDWTNIPYIKDCYYISGHTHNNYIDEEFNYYADGQWGYNGNDYVLHYIEINNGEISHH